MNTHASDPFAAMDAEIRKLKRRVASLEQTAISNKQKLIVPKKPTLAAGTIVADVIDQASARFGIAVEFITSPSRKPYLVEARDWLIYEAHIRGISASDIGAAINRDHSSVGSAIAREAKRRAAQ